MNHKDFQFKNDKYIIYQRILIFLFNLILLHLLPTQKMFNLASELFPNILKLGLSYLEPLVAPFNKLFGATGSIKKAIWSHQLSQPGLDLYTFISPFTTSPYLIDFLITNFSVPYLYNFSLIL